MTETEDTRMVDAWDCWKSALAFRCARHAHPKALSDRTLWTTFSAGFVAADDDCQSRIDAAVAKERERCIAAVRAKADEFEREWRDGLKADIYLQGKSDGADDAAVAIRAISPTPTTEEGA